MGIWGTGIYSNDTAEDVRDACKDIFAFYGVEEGNQKLFQFFQDIVEQDYVDNDYASFWYALADWQWKHGMLNDYVKNKTLELLSVYAGLDEWIETGDKNAVVRRRKVLEKLKTQLNSHQNIFKKPSLNLAKPKHKSGDIIVFKATEFVDEWDSAWHITNFRPPFMFSSDMISTSLYENISGYDAHEKYMAVLCVGSQKEVHSEYTPEVFDEYSLYVWYDYLSVKKPDAIQLSSCGFLPMVKWKMKDYNNGITDFISWIYRFTLSNDLFKSNPYINFENKKSNVINEVKRFNQLFSFKDYPLDYYEGDDLVAMFYIAFEEKNRMELLGESIDNLLDENATNPKFLTPLEIDKADKTYRHK